MRLAVFTNQFPGPVCTFFARDMRGLIDAGAEIDVFPIYPLDPTQWKYVPNILNETVLPRSGVHHLNLGDCVRGVSKFLHPQKSVRFLRDALSISGSAIRYGIEPSLKTVYTFAKALSWVKQYGNQVDHVLGYWGNYAGTCAYLFHRLIERPIPFSLFLHAGTDLYRTPIFMRQKLLYADSIITCSDFNYQFLKERFFDIAHRLTDKIYVHHHGLDLVDFSFESNDRSPRTLIAVGRIEKEKGFDYLIRAVHRLGQVGVKVNVDIVGDGSQAKYLKALANTLNVADLITFRGWCTSDETKDAMKRAAVLVHPSPELGDGVPNVIKECMALGTPVIGSRVAGIPELLDNGKFGILVPPKDVNALALAIRRLLLDDELQKHLAIRARKYVEEKFDMSANGQRLAEVLGSVRRQASASADRECHKKQAFRQVV